MSKCFGPFKELFKGLFVHGQKIAEFNQKRQMTQITQAKSGYVEKLVIVAMQKLFFLKAINPPCGRTAYIISDEILIVVKENTDMCYSLPDQTVVTRGIHNCIFEKNTQFD